jgi:hypothetical protein
VRSFILAPIDWLYGYCTAHDVSMHEVKEGGGGPTFGVLLAAHRPGVTNQLLAVYH